MPLPTKVNVTRPEAWGYDALIEYGPTAADSLYLRLAVGPGRPMQFQTVDPEPRTPNLSENPEDMRVESGQSFSRSDFGGGEGLRRAHRREGTPRDFTRFYDSKGVNITPSAKAGEAASVTLLKSTTKIRSHNTSSDNFKTILVGGSLFTTTSHQRVDVSTDPTAGTPTWNSEDPHDSEGNQEVQGLTALGGEVYASCASNAIHKRTTGGAWSHWSDLNPGTPVKLEAVKERILAWWSSQLYEAKAGANSVLLMDTGSSDDYWNGVTDAGSHIVAVNANGYAYMWASEEGELVLQGQTRITASPDEELTAVTAVSGLVFFASRELDSNSLPVGRLYRGVLIGGQIREIQLLRTWTTAQPNGFPSLLVRTRDAIWWAIQSSATTTDVWKYSLTTGGTFRDLEITGTTPAVAALAIVSIDDRLFVHIQSGSTAAASGIWREDTTFADSGYLISPLADFFSAAAKTWVGARLHTGSLPTGTQVVLAYSTDPAALDDSGHASWTDTITATPAAPGVSAETAITGVEARYAAVKLTLTPDGSNVSTPEVLTFALRGIHQPVEDDYALPVNISDRLELPHRKPLLVNGVGDAVYEKLQTLIGTAVTVTLLRPDESVVGQLRTLSTPVQELPERGSPTTYALLTVRGARQ